MEWLSLLEIAEQVGVSEEAARRYASVFKDFLPCKDANGSPVYPRQSVEIFRRIVEADKESGEDLAELVENSRSLAKKPFLAVMEPDRLDADNDSMDLSETLGQLMESVSRCLIVIADQRAIIQEQREDIHKLKNGFVLLARRHKKLALSTGRKEAYSVEYIDRVVRDSLAGHEALAQELLDRDQEFEARCSQLEKSQSDVLEEAQRLETGQQELHSKLNVLEAELVRLRKDRREMEKYLTDKIRRLKQTA
ncbi:MAG: hypothetical protein AB7D07_04340 [Desulfovibrionaceae bacterium]|jgi:hypothetical protein